MDPRAEPEPSKINQGVPVGRERRNPTGNDPG
jgi:hypothetical protein